MQCVHCSRSMSICEENGEFNAEALFDQHNINVLLSLVDESETFTQIFHEILKSKHIDKLKFMQNLAFRILNTENDTKISNIFSYFDLLNHFKNVFLAGESLSILLRNSLFWNLKKKELSAALTCACELLIANEDKYKIDKMCDDGLLERLVLALHMNTECQDVLLKMISELLKVTGAKYAAPVIDFCRISPYFKPFAELDDVIESSVIVRNTEIQIKLMLLIVNDPRIFKTISFNILVQFAAETDFFNAKMCVLELLEQMVTNKEARKYVPIISRVCKKYYNDAVVWESVISKIINEKFEFENAWKHSFAIKRPIFIIFVLELMTSYSQKENETDFCQILFTITECLLKSSPQILLTRLVAPFFFHFIACPTPDNDDEPPDLSNSSIEPELIEIFKGNYKKWKKKSVKKDKKISKMYIDKVGKLLSDVTLIAAEKVELIRIICQFADKNIAHCYLDCLISSLIEEGLQLKMAPCISREVMWISINRSNIFSDVSIDSLLLTAVDGNHAVFDYFLHFFLMRIEKMAPEVIEALFMTFTNTYIKHDNHLICTALYIISRVIQSNISRELPFLEAFFQKTKKALEGIEQQNFPLGKNIIEAENFASVTFTEEDVAGFNQVFNQKEEVKLAEVKNWSLPFNEDYIWPSSHKYYAFYIRNVRTQLRYQEKLKHYVDLDLREAECFESALIFHKQMSDSQSMLSPKEVKQRANSYRISSFFSPCTTPTVLFPSTVKLYPPNSEKEVQKEEEKFSFVGNKAPFVYSHTKFAVSFKDDLFNQLKEMYKGRDFVNCTIIRLFTRVKAVVFRTDDYNIFMILLNATFDEEKEEIRFEKETDQYQFMFNSVLEGDYGNFTLFAGHPMIIFHQDYSIILEYNSCAIESSVQVFSKTNGVFILEFEGKQIIYGNKFDITCMKEKWESGILSNYDYLLAVNQAAERSFVDLACYPIFPRVLTDFTKSEIGPFRDLSKPVQIVNDKDPEHNLLSVRYNVQKYHHSDNISNPHFVSGNLVRIAPFCNAHWELNEKWDANTRMMISIPNHYSISNHTIYELIPESFSFVEALINVNKFVLPTKEELDIILPEWAESPSDFILKHKKSLESPEVSSDLNKWIDLVFGSKSRNQEAINEFNTYNPLSYINTNEKNTKEKHMWIMTCGQVPQRVFKFAHPKKISKSQSSSIQRYASIEFAVEIDNSSSIISISDLKIKLPTSGCINGRCDGKTLVLTYNRFVYACTLPTQKPLAFLFKTNSLFSVPCTKLMICATAFENKVIIWSLGNGSIINIIDIERPQRIVFVKNDNSIVIEYAGGRIATTPSGTLL